MKSDLSKYVTPKIARETLGISDETLCNLACNGEISYIRTKGNQRLYDLSTFRPEKERVKDVSKQSNIYYPSDYSISFITQLCNTQKFYLLNCYALIFE